jgi:hypothetical protein
MLSSSLRFWIPPASAPLQQNRKGGRTALASGLMIPEPYARKAFEWAQPWTHFRDGQWSGKSLIEQWQKEFARH